jgi:hypothetical protein
MESKIFNEIAKKEMVKWDFEDFKKTYPTLFNVIKWSMLEYHQAKTRDESALDEYKIKLAIRTISMLSSMIECGEGHSEISKDKIANAMNSLELLK